MYCSRSVYRMGPFLFVIICICNRLRDSCHHKRSTERYGISEFAALNTVLRTSGYGGREGGENKGPCTGKRKSKGLRERPELFQHVSIRESAWLT